MVIKAFIIVIACMIIAYHCGYVNAINDINVSDDIKDLINDIQEDENNETDL